MQLDEEDVTEALGHALSRLSLAILMAGPRARAQVSVAKMDDGLSKANLADTPSGSISNYRFNNDREIVLIITSSEAELGLAQSSIKDSPNPF